MSSTLTLPALWVGIVNVVLLIPRYMLITAVAAHYGRSFLRILRHPQQYLLISLLITAVLILIAFLLTTRRRPSWQPRPTTEL